MYSLVSCDAVVNHCLNLKLGVNGNGQLFRFCSVAGAKVELCAGDWAGKV